MADPVADLQHRLGYTFSDPKLLELALTHPSWLQEHPEETTSNQRLEFLGDAVLQLVLTRELFTVYPEEREGELSKRRSALTNGPYLATLSQEIDLGLALRLSSAEEESGGRSRESALEDAFEAVLGAVFQDGGFAAANEVIMRIYGDLSRRLQNVISTANPKGQLQERVQPSLGNNALRYEVNHIAGEDHAREYEATVFLEDEPIGTGRGTSKKSAEEAAARAGLDSPAVPASQG